MSCMWCGKVNCEHQRLESGVRMSVMIGSPYDPFFRELSDPAEGRVSNTSGEYPRGVGPYRVDVGTSAHGQFLTMRQALRDHPRAREAITVYRDADGAYRVCEEGGTLLVPQPI